MRFLYPIVDTVFPPRDTELLVRAMSEDALIEQLQPLITKESQLHVLSLMQYARENIQACVLEAKFHGNVRAAALLGTVLAEFLYEFLSESAEFFDLPPVLVPVPLSPRRLHERGYNQVERVFASVAAQLPFASELFTTTPLLTRTRDTVPQTSSGGVERRQNLQGAFRATAPISPARTYIVVDDVTTTGSTLAAACQALAAAGARHIIPLALAR